MNIARKTREQKVKLSVVLSAFAVVFGLVLLVMLYHKPDKTEALGVEGAAVIDPSAQPGAGGSLALTFDSGTFGVFKSINMTPPNNIGQALPGWSLASTNTLAMNYWGLDEHFTQQKSGVSNIPVYDAVFSVWVYFSSFDKVNDNWEVDFVSATISIPT